MTLAIRFLLAVTLLAGIVLNNVYACSPIRVEDGRGGYRLRTDEELYALASSVFVAHVIKVEEVVKAERGSSNPSAAVEATFRVIEILKGRPPDDAKVWTRVPEGGNCSVPLFIGFDYLFFLRPEDDNFIVWPTGSRGFLDIEGAEPKALLARLRALNK